MGKGAGQASPVHRFIMGATKSKTKSLPCCRCTPSQRHRLNTKRSRTWTHTLFPFIPLQYRLPSLRFWLQFKISFNLQAKIKENLKLGDIDAIIDDLPEWKLYQSHKAVKKKINRSIKLTSNGIYGQLVDD